MSFDDVLRHVSGPNALAQPAKPSGGVGAGLALLAGVVALAVTYKKPLMGLDDEPRVDELDDDAITTTGEVVIIEAAAPPRETPEAWAAKWGAAYAVPGNPPSFVRDEQTWERAKTAVRPYWSQYASPWAAVVSTYRHMGGRTA